MATATAVHRSSKTESYVDNKRKDDVRQANIVAARTVVADAVRTSLGPKGMDKMISTASTGEVIITKDGWSHHYQQQDGSSSSTCSQDARRNVLLIQKGILRDAVADLSLHYLSKSKILVIKDVDRDEIEEFITKTLNCLLPIANIEHFREEKLGRADCVEEISLGDGGEIVKITGIKDMGRTTNVLVRGSNRLVLDEAESSLHDALCVIRCLVTKRFVIAAAGGAIFFH